MGEKITKICRKIYSITILVAFFAGILPLIPYIVAIIIGGSTAEAICHFIYNHYYPWVIALAAVSVLIGLVGMYTGKMIKSEWGKKKERKKKDATDNAELVDELKENESK